ncbi:hypothetical protein HNP65_001216 [Thermosipho japonicus]|uniref:RES domain-containing protein n=1 Tax=Thermosipho japonicus TaxID=90323 RepID=A0A841GNM0_9BACT|nr:RES domain-containing protein [Thermosipho japonicus]MBB6062764.1 hypothetical protein [Thermosipho japonicus]
MKNDENYCCTKCFEDNHIKDYIKSKGTIGKCSICQKENVHISKFSDVANFIIEGLRKAYDIVENEGFWDPEAKCFKNPVNDNNIGKSIFKILFSEEKIFSNDFDEKAAKEFLQKLMNSIKPTKRDIAKGDNDLYSDIESPNWMFIGEFYYSEDEEKKKKLFYSWNEFKKVTKYNFRFFDVSKCKKRIELLRELKNIFNKMEKELPEGKTLYRSRIYNNPLENLKIPCDIGPAPINNTKNNRFSPAGISYMYLSEDMETCINEVNPQIKDNVLVGEFKLKKKINILNLTDSPVKSIFCNDYDHKVRMIFKNFIIKFAEEVSKPMKISDNKEIEYVPTQVLSEYVRKLGYKGIMYKSSLNKDSYNYVLFFGPEDDNNEYIEYFENYLELKNLFNVEITKIKITYKKKN